VTPLVALGFYFLMPFDGHRWIISASAGVVATLLTVPYALRRLGKIRTASHPLAEALAIISLMVSVIIVGFASGYYSIAIHSDQFPELHTRIDGLYFTIVTIGTVGYGDISPEGQGARALVSLQIMLNLTLIGTILRLLSRAASDSRNARRL